MEFPYRLRLIITESRKHYMDFIVPFFYLPINLQYSTVNWRLCKDNLH